ncbi:hypothetical protein H4W33_003006 [Kibdelosporangium phytohabitans]|nr:hypothetical protein [Kibdelosporangium phytohabitans]
MRPVGSCLPLSGQEPITAPDNDWGGVSGLSCRE